MTETVEKRKKLYKVATELNLSHETLIEFLRKKGHEVKSHMSSVDEEMMKDILVHFKKEKDSAEKHQRKIAEIRESKKRAERKVEDVVETPPAAVPADAVPASGDVEEPTPAASPEIVEPAPVAAVAPPGGPVEEPATPAEPEQPESAPHSAEAAPPPKPVAA